MTHSTSRIAVVFLCAVALATGAAAQDATLAPDAPALSVSLNASQPHNGSCRLTFVTRNKMPADIEELAIEIAIFRQTGSLDRLMRLNLGRLLEGRTRVSQFDVGSMPCETIKSVLVNDVIRCKGGALTPLDCLRALTVSSATDVEIAL